MWVIFDQIELPVLVIGEKILDLELELELELLILLEFGDKLSIT
jgi:hypothetical protein